MSAANTHAMGAAPGKVILFGEHAVVHGRSAIAAALSHGLGAVVNRRQSGSAQLHIPRWGRSGLHLDASTEGPSNDAVARAFTTALDMLNIPRETPIDITMDGELPLGVGLGSSAAFSVALLRTLLSYQGTVMSDRELIGLAHRLERIFHGNPSGLDHSVIIRNECALFRPTSPPEFKSITLGVDLPLVVAWIPRMGTTKDAVTHVSKVVAAQPTLCTKLFDFTQEIVDEAVPLLEQGDLGPLGALMNLNHGVLSALGVVSAENERMISVARQAGALGAKVTGAGFGGAILALAPGCGPSVRDALIKAGFPALLNQIRNH